MKTIKNIVLSLLALAFITSNAFALGSEELIVREYNKSSNAEYHDHNDSTLMNIHYTGASTESIVAVTLDTMTIAEPYGTTALTYDLGAAAYDTLGELCDAINTEDDYTCTLIEGKRDDDSSYLTNITGTVTTTDAKQAGGYYTVGIDTGSTVSDGSEEFMTRLGIIPQSGKRVVLKYCNVTTDGVGTLSVYGKLKKFEGVSDGVTRNDTTVVVTSMATANDTAEVNGNIYGGAWLTFAKDEHVLISALGTEDQTTTAFLECYWDEK